MIARPILPLYIFSAFYRDIYFVRAFQTISDNDMAAGGKWRKAVYISTFYMIQSILRPPT